MRLDAYIIDLLYCLCIKENKKINLGKKKLVHTSLVLLFY